MLGGQGAILRRVALLMPCGRCGCRGMLDGAWGQCSSAPLSGWGDLPAQAPGLIWCETLSACLCAGSLETLLWCGLALAACRRSCARHPPCPPTAAPAGALAEVCHLQQGSVLVLRLELSVRRGACGRAWEGAGGAAVSCPRCPVRAAACPCPLLLRSLRRCVPAAALRRVRSPRAKCRDGSREQLALQPASQLPPMQHPLPSPGKGQVSLVPPCSRFGRCPHGSGCHTPSRSVTKPLLSGTAQGWGGRLGCFPPEYQSGGGACLPW